MSKRDLLFDQLTKKRKQSAKKNKTVLSLITTRESFPCIRENIVDSIPTLEQAILDEFDDPTKVDVELRISRQIRNCLEKAVDYEEPYEFALNKCETALFAHSAWKSFVRWISDLRLAVKESRHRNGAFDVAALLEHLRFKETLQIEFARFKTAWQEAHPQYQCVVKVDMFARIHGNDILSTMLLDMPILLIRSKKT
jgi:hypothetical protein